MASKAEEALTRLLGDEDSKRFGTGWISGVLALALGLLCERRGFAVAAAAEAVAGADLVVMLAADEDHGRIYADELAPNLKEGAALSFAHGLSIRFGLIEPRADLDIFLVAPKGPGTALRADFERGSGLTRACGTGACATAVAAIRSKRVSSPVKVTMPGGSLTIAWAPGDPIRMTGAATHVYRGEIDIEALA